MGGIAAAGSSEFILGFQLAGVKTVHVYKDYFVTLKSLKDFSIVVVEEVLLESLPNYERSEIESSIDPVFVPLSEKVEQDSLRRLIKKSVGIDVWK